MKKPTKPLTRPADGWKLATCETCSTTNYVNPPVFAREPYGWCQTCRGWQPHTLVSNPAPAPIQ